MPPHLRVPARSKRQPAFKQYLRDAQMIDLRSLETFSMTYVFRDENGEMAYEYEQIGTPVVSADGQSITFVLKNIEENEDDEQYSLTLIKSADDEFSVKSDYFENPEELYEMNAEVSEEEVCFSSFSAGEGMYLYGFFA